MSAPRHRIHHRRVGSAGFTLFELLVALGILALLAGAVVMIIPSRRQDDTAVRAAAATLARNLAGLRSRAMAENRDASLSLGDRIQESGRDIEVMSWQGDQAVPGASVTFGADGGSPGARIILSRGEARREVRVSWPFGRMAIVGDR